MVRSFSSAPGPRFLPPLEAAITAAHLALSSGTRQEQVAFLEQLDRLRAPLIAAAARGGVGLHDAEDGVADVLARWCEQVLGGEIPEAPVDETWRELLARQVDGRVRPRHLRRAGGRRRTLSIDRLRDKVRDILADAQAETVPAVDLHEFLAVHPQRLLTPAEFKLFVSLVEGIPDISADGVDPSTRVILCRLRRRLRDALRAA